MGATALRACGSVRSARPCSVKADDLDPVGSPPRDAETTYADQLVLEVVAISGDRSVEDAVIWIEAQGVSGPPGWVEVVTTDALSEVGVADGYYLEHRRSVTEWGASGATEQMVVTLGQGVFAEAAVLLALRLARRVVAQIRGEDDEPPLQEEDAAVWARTRVAIKYGVDAGDLSIAATGTRDDGSVAVALVGADGARYELRLQGLRAGVQVLECTRTYPEVSRG